MTEAATGGVPYEKVFLEISQNSQENTRARVSFLIELQAFIKKETLAQVLSWEFCEMLKNTFFREHLRVAPSDMKTSVILLVLLVESNSLNQFDLQRNTSKSWWAISIGISRNC